MFSDTSGFPIGLVTVDSVGTAARDLVALLSFRALPMIGAVIASRSRGAGAKACVALSYVGIAYASRAWDGPKSAALVCAYAYFAFAAWAVPAATRALRAGQLTRGGLFAAASIVFLLIPSLVAPASARVLVLLVGWDLVLSSYSYAVEVARSGEDPTLGECLFFLLVNPALVYPLRGERIGAPALRWRGVARGLVALLTLLGTSAILSPVCGILQDPAHAVPVLGGPLAAAAAFGVLRFFVEYGRQAGVASLQIGMMQQVGYTIPERFLNPLAARDPLDFWRRWNTYVGGWVLRYVFWPVGHRLRGTGRTWRLRMAQATAILATFVFVGLIHDEYTYAVSLDANGQALRAFGAIGVVALGWVVVSRAWAHLAPQSRIDHGRVALRILSRASFLAIAVACVAWGWR